MKLKFVNLTSRTLTIDGVGSLPPSGVTARLTFRREMHDPVAGVRCIRQDFGPVENIPPPEEGTVYLVSAIVLSAILTRVGDPLADRLGKDIFAPDTGPDATRMRGDVVSVRGVVW